MDLLQAISEIRSRVKPYLHVGMPASTFYNTLRNMEAGNVKTGTVEKFMSKFGYVKKQVNEEWIQNHTDTYTL